MSKYEWLVGILLFPFALLSAESPTKKIVIALVILVLLPLYFAPTHGQAQSFEPPSFDPTRLVFETVAGDYGNIYNVIQDKDGFLWLAGINGAIKYNGYEAETIYSGETVSAMFQDSEGLIWMVVESGVAVYDKKTGKTTRYVPNPNDPNVGFLNEHFPGYVFLCFCHLS